MLDIQSAGESSPPTLAAEFEAAAAGARCIAGVDEVGRGALAGPVVAAAVVLPLTDDAALEALSGVRDSKRLTPRQRCDLYGTIVAHASGVGVGAVEPVSVDALGIRPATELAMVRALRALPRRPDLALVDGYAARLIPIRQLAIVRGDRHVLSIAAASIAAKVVRDAYMIALGFDCGVYGHERHKGYSTPEHLRAIHVWGASTHHRLTWAPLSQVPGSSHFGQPVLPGFAGPARQPASGRVAAPVRAPSELRLGGRWAGLCPWIVGRSEGDAS